VDKNHKIKLKGMAHMPYTIKFQDILLPNWLTFDGSGVYDQPARNIKQNNQKNGCIIIGNEGLAVYKCYLHILETRDDGEEFIDMADPGDFDKLKYLLSEKVIEESKIMYERYLEHQASHTDYALINKN
jgi:hypothetical protein